MAISAYGHIWYCVSLILHSCEMSAKRYKLTLNFNLSEPVCGHWHIIKYNWYIQTMLLDNTIRMHSVLFGKIWINLKCNIVKGLFLFPKSSQRYYHFTWSVQTEHIIACKMCDYNSGRLYEDAFNISFSWKKWLPPDVYRYHELVCKEVNAPVELQIFGILLPFISSVCGPLTKGHFLTRPSCLNLFWLKPESTWFHSHCNIYYRTLSMVYRISKFQSIQEQVNENMVFCKHFYLCIYWYKS